MQMLLQTSGRVIAEYSCKSNISLAFTLILKKVMLSNYTGNKKHTTFPTLVPSSISKGGFALNTRRHLADVCNPTDTDAD